MCGQGREDKDARTRMRGQGYEDKDGRTRIRGQGCEGLFRPALEAIGWFLTFFAESSLRLYLEVWESSRASRNHSYITWTRCACVTRLVGFGESFPLHVRRCWMGGQQLLPWLAEGALLIVQLSLLITTPSDQCERQQEPNWHFSTAMTHVCFATRLFFAPPHRLWRWLRVRLATGNKQTLCKYSGEPLLGLQARVSVLKCLGNARKTSYFWAHSDLMKWAFKNGENNGPQLSKVNRDKTMISLEKCVEECSLLTINKLFYSWPLRISLHHAVLSFSPGHFPFFSSEFKVAAVSLGGTHIASCCSSALLFPPVFSERSARLEDPLLLFKLQAAPLLQLLLLLQEHVKCVCKAI